MNKDDARALNALAYAGLEEPALIAKLAHKSIGKEFTLTEARTLVRSIFPKRGDLERLSVAVLNEKNRQEPIRNTRRALAKAEEKRRLPYTTPFRYPEVLRRDDEYREVDERRRQEFVRHAQNQFGGFIKAVFDSEILALMELCAEDCRAYRVDWLDGGNRPAISAIVKVTVEGPRVGAFQDTFLLYKEPGSCKARAVSAGGREDVKSAWAYQVPMSAIALSSYGYKFRTAFDTQELVATGPEGDEQRFRWRGRADERE